MERITETVTKFKTSDGQVFTDEVKASEHERIISRSDFQKFFDEAHTRPFSKKLTLEQYGVFRITDEGPVDFGSGGRPVTLGYYEGTYKQAIEVALTLPRFRGWGFGYIELIEVKKL